MPENVAPEIAVRVADISFAYGNVRAVDGVSFDVGRGETLGFLGPNGAGKSTAIKMLTGQIDPDAGSISILGLDMPGAKREIQARIGVSFEEKNLYSNMSGNENLRFFAQLFGIDDFDPAPLLELVDLAARGADRVSTYSKGMQQRLMVARSLINEPEVLFLDEPTAGLDPVSARSIHRIIERQAEHGSAVVLTTHDMAEADKLSDRVAFINEGKIIALDTPEQLKLSFGTRSVRVRTRHDGAVSETVIPLDESDAPDRLGAAVTDEGLLTIHTQEATLEDVFVHFAGRGLGDA